MFVDNGIVYLLTDDTNIYELSTTYPYTQTLTTSIGGAGTTNSITQQTNCFTEQFDVTYVNCGTNITSTNISSGADFYRLYSYITVGSGTGIVEVTFGQITPSTYNTPLRFQIEWNGTIVADSLWVANTISPTSYTLITGSTQGQSIRDCFWSPGNGTGNTTVSPLTDWVLLGIDGIPAGTPFATLPEIANSSIPRSTGSPGQIGVVNTYPTPITPSSSSDIKLQFTKTSANPDYIKVIVYTPLKNSFTFQTTQCP